MFKPVKLVNVLLTLVLLLVILAHIIGLSSFQFIHQFERQIYDIQLTQSMPGGVDSNVAIANIDEKSLKELGQWPWRRDVLAQLVNTLFDHYQIKALGFDMVFSEPSDNTASEVLELLASSDLSEHVTFQSAYQQLQPQIDYDQQFADALEGRNVVMGIVFESGQKAPVNQLPAFFQQLNESNNLVAAQSYVANLPLLHQATSYSGFFDNPLLDDDGVFRRVPLVQRIEQYIYPSLSLQLAQLALDDNKLNLELDEIKGRYYIDQLSLGKTSVPVTGNGAILVPYRGGQGSFDYFSIYELLTQQVDQQKLQNKVLLMGTDAAGLLDLRTTPFAKSYPGVEVHANIVAGILDGRVKQPLRDPLMFLLASVLVCALLLFGLTQLRDVRVQLVGFIALISLVLLSRVYFWQQGLVLPIAEVLALVIALFVSLTLINSMQEAKQKRQIARRFGQYIPPQLVAEMSRSPEKYQIKNQTKELTVMFCDIRSFTAISEKLTADELSELMNLYLSRMTQVIQKCNGTIDKYMGDAIMAFWGAPIDNPNHALDAAKAANMMLDELVDLNVELTQKGWPQLNIGIGLNSGEMFVGEFGTSFRMAYTVMGDAVNLASRLEGLTKQYGVTCLVSHSAANLLANGDNSLQEIDVVRVKGKQEPVAIYQLLPAKSRLLTDFVEFLSAYRLQNWRKARQLLGHWEQENEVLAAMYLERVQRFEKLPPNENWDGVYSHETK